jgi:hypothetical protein
MICEGERRLKVVAAVARSGRGGGSRLVEEGKAPVGQ